jgi:hypothetical protein
MSGDEVGVHSHDLKLYKIDKLLVLNRNHKYQPKD